MAKIIVYGPKVEEVPQEKPEPKDQNDTPEPAPEVDDSTYQEEEAEGNTAEFDYPAYDPNVAKEESIPMMYTLIAAILGGIVIILAVILLTRPTELPVEIAQYSVECSEDGTSMLLLTDCPDNTRVDVYKDNQLMTYDQSVVKGGVRITGVEPGMYVVHAVTVTRSCVIYGLVQVNLLSASKYEGLTQAVANAVKAIKDDGDKRAHCEALFQNYEKHALARTTDVEALLRSTNATTNEILGFDAPDAEQVLDNEAEWYTIFKPNGLIDKYLKEHDIFITVSNYRYVMTAIALGLREGAK